MCKRITYVSFIVNVQCCSHGPTECLSDTSEADFFCEEIFPPHCSGTGLGVQRKASTWFSFNDLSATRSYVFSFVLVELQGEIAYIHILTTSKS